MKNITQLWAYILNLAAYIGIVILLTTCAAEPDGPGFCSLNCSDAKIATDDFKIEFLGFSEGLDLTLHCQGLAAGSPYFSEVPIRFKFLRKASTLKSILPATGTEEATEEKYVPVSGISYEVTIMSGSTSGENPDDPSGKYKGILTSQEEWCTDSCGVGSIDVLPQCQPASHVVNVLVRSGNVAKVLSINVDPN